ncbi:MAG: hypothetical protein PARBA_03017 [Parabacteroides sp.]
MDKLNFVFLIKDDRCWEELFSHIINFKKQPAMTDKIAVISIGTALLSCLKSTHLDTTKSTITYLNNENVEFYQCINTLSRYGIDEKMLLPEISIAREGGLMKVAYFESMGYHSFTLC